MSSNQLISCDEVKTIVEAAIKQEVYLSVNPTEYKSIMSSVNYVIMSTRPDLAFTVSFLGRYAHASTKLHMNTVHKMLQYLCTYPDMSLTYQKESGTCTFYSYVNADYGGLHD